MGFFKVISLSELLARVDFFEGTEEELHSRIFNSSNDDSKLAIRLINVWSLVCAEKLPEYKTILESNGINIVDSFWLSRVLDRKRFRKKHIKLRGSDLFRSTLASSLKENKSHYLLGTTDQNLIQLERKLVELYPGIKIAGKQAPLIEINDSQKVNEISQQVLRSKADVLWVALGTPKQDVLGVRFAQETNKPVIAVGAAFDFISESKREAPKFVRLMGLEWLFRLFSEPIRLWDRYLLGNTRFLMMVLKK
jgi:N-acetylglucosaminyldiphosphoundecaprenol N-acetyl-beta-D-mannosaminyltransferase